MDRSIPIYGTMPDDVQEYSRTKIFTDQSVPAKLKEDHSLQAGVWGLLQMVSGTLKFYLEDPRVEIEVRQGQSVVIPPISRHRIMPCGQASFYIGFFRRQHNGAVT